MDDESMKDVLPAHSCLERRCCVVISGSDWESGQVPGTRHQAIRIIGILQGNHRERIFSTRKTYQLSITIHKIICFEKFEEERTILPQARVKRGYLACDHIGPTLLHIGTNPIFLHRGQFHRNPQRQVKASKTLNKQIIYGSI
jgi:hypothetical protein